MKFIEKYWWVLLILVVGAIVLYMYFSKEKTVTPTTTPNPCAASNFAAKIKALEDAIDASPTWKAQVTAETTNTEHGCFGKTYAECRKQNAIYQLLLEGTIPSTCEGKVV